MTVSATTATQTDVTLDDIRQGIRDIPNFPKPGIVFKDITTILNDPRLLAGSIDLMAQVLADQDVEYIVGIEARGFIFGAALAYKLGVAFVPIRKKGKLPSKTVSYEYELEYGEDCIEIHEDAIPEGGKVVLVDDLLATGGTAKASAALLKQIGADLTHMLFLVELGFLAGRDGLPDDVTVNALVNYTS